MTPKRADAALEVVPGTRASSPTPDDLPTAPDGEGEEVSLREYLDVLVENRWVVAIAVVVAVMLGGAYALLASPQYRSDALVQVENKSGASALLGDLTALSDTTPADTEIEILRSRALVGAVVDQLKLDVVARPRRFPVLGAALGRWHDPDDGVAAPPLGLGRFGWGGERIRLDRFEIPDRLLDSKLKLVVGEAGRYEIFDAKGRMILAGEVGKPAEAGAVRAFVAELVARPGTQFRVARLRRDRVIEDLQKDLRIAERGKKTGIIELALEDDDAARAGSILDALSRAYQRQNVERKSAEAEKTLSFLDSQLPTIRANLDAAEKEFEAYRAKNGSVDVTVETQAAVGRAVEIEKALSEIQVEYAALREKFTDEHPALQGLLQKVKRLETERAAIDARMRKLPANELESAKRMRDVKVASELYLTLLNKSQELKVVKEGTIGNVRILDAALMPVEPVSPKKARVLAISLLLGLVAGVALAFARRALDQGIEDPDAVERATGIGVHASIPHSIGHGESERRAKRDRTATPILAEVDPKDLAIESLRSLRTSLQFALFEARNQIVAISGPAPGVGKSFVSVNLAHLLGEADKKVVVVDADLRRGHLHRYYGGDRGAGLSDVIRGQATLDETIRPTPSPNVHFLPTGTIPPNPAELLGSERFQRVLADLAERFELVLLDTPPILAVTDAALIGRHAGVNLLVVRAGAHPMREILAALRALGRGGIRVHGMVMNGVRLDRGLGRRNAYHYQYHYK